MKIICILISFFINDRLNRADRDFQQKRSLIEDLRARVKSYEERTKAEKSEQVLNVYAIAHILFSVYFFISL